MDHSPAAALSKVCVEVDILSEHQTIAARLTTDVEFLPRILDGLLPAGEDPDEDSAWVGEHGRSAAVKGNPAPMENLQGRSI